MKQNPFIELPSGDVQCRHCGAINSDIPEGNGGCDECRQPEERDQPSFEEVTDPGVLARAAAVLAKAATPSTPGIR